MDEAAQKIGGNPDRQVLMAALIQAGREIEVLAGRSFHPARRATSVIESNGLPFVDVPDLLVGSMEPVEGVWAVPDPVNNHLAAVLQVLPLHAPAPSAVPAAKALSIAGHLVAQASQAGHLTAGYVLYWLGAVDHEQRMELFRRVMDPGVRFSVPVLMADGDGWWIQITRRLIWVTNETEDEGRLIQPLLNNKGMTDGDVPPLAAVEPILTVARMTRQPVDWAFTARLWTDEVERTINRPWRRLAKAVHDHGIPTITIDPSSTPEEIACQVVLKGYWHGYVQSDEPALADAVAQAYPRQVERIQRETRAPTRTAAAATLLGQLIRPGFDPAQGAEATRRYVRRKASIVVMEHRKTEAPDRYPWTQVGISERRYYKLLPLFAQKVNGRYVLDQDDVVARMKAHLDGVDKARDIRTQALDVLRLHGFNEAAARKWLQRHKPEQAVNAWPRGPRP